MQEEVTFAYLSDPHLFFGLPDGLQWISKRGLSGLSWLRKRQHHHLPAIAERLREDLLAHNPDMIVMGGDLINFGLKKEFAQSRKWLESLGPPEKVMALPGNHEAMMPGWKGLIDSEWGPYSTFRQDGSVVARPLGPATLIAVSTAIATPPFLASGRVGELQRQSLEQTLNEARQNQLCPIVVMHHPPTPVTSRRKGLSDRKAVCEVLSRGGAQLVLHGHTHHAELSWIISSSGQINVLGIPSFSLKHQTEKYSGAWRKLRITKENESWTLEVTERVVDDEENVVSMTPLNIRLGMDV